MLDLDVINSTIEELENGDTNFTTCQKLSSLYIVRKFYGERTNSTHPVESELEDILPQYRKYCKLKREYQLSMATQAQVVDSLKLVCKEIEEFLSTLYSSTDMPEEREIIQNLLHSFVVST